MSGSILNMSWRQHQTQHQLYGHLPSITKIIQVRRTRHAGHCWRSRDELINDVRLLTPTYRRAKAGWPARTYIQQLCEDTRCSPEDQPEVMNDRETWRERVRDIRDAGTTWWWWWWWWWRLSFYKDGIWHWITHKSWIAINKRNQTKPIFIIFKDLFKQWMSTTPVGSAGLGVKTMKRLSILTRAHDLQPCHN